MHFPAIKTLRTLSLTIVLASVLVALPAVADTTSDPYGLQKTATEAKLDVSKNLNEVIGGIIKTVLGITAVLFMIIIIGAGQMWLGAGGNEESIKKAHEIIFNAAVGFMICFGAYLGTDWLVKSVLATIGVSSS